MTSLYSTYLLILYNTIIYTRGSPLFDWAARASLIDANYIISYTYIIIQTNNIYGFLCSRRSARWSVHVWCRGGSMAGGTYIEKWQFGPDNKNVFYDYRATHFLYTHSELLVCVCLYIYDIHTHTIYLYIYTHRNSTNTAEVCVCVHRRLLLRVCTWNGPVDFMLLHQLKSRIHNHIICLYIQTII